MNTLKIAPDLYSNVPKTAISGARKDVRTISLATTDLITTQLVALAVLPAGHMLTDFVLESDQLDSNVTTTLTATVGILNTYFNQAPATAAKAANYNPTTKDAAGNTIYAESPATDQNTDTQPALVANHNIITADNTVAAGGRKGPSLAFTRYIGIDKVNDRIIALQFPAVPATAKAGNVTFIVGIDFAN
jgi:hypothetical protein